MDIKIGIYIWSIGFATATGLLHLLLYLFYPRLKANLFFGVFAFGVALRNLTADILEGTTFAAVNPYFVGTAGEISLAATVFFFVLFLYEAFSKSIGKLFWSVILIWIPLMVFQTIFNPLSNFKLSEFLLSLFVIVESLRIIIKGAYFERKEGAWIIGLGALIVAIAPVKEALTFIMSAPLPDFWNTLINQLALSGIIVANSVYLARSFAFTNKRLEEQIRQVKELSRREIEHERAAAGLRLENERERAQRELIERELKLAADIQQALFPEKIPLIENCEVSAFNRPALVCGGDYYDVLPLGKGSADAGSYVFCVADVAGKGLPAALLMSSMQATLRALAAGRAESLASLAGSINDLLYAASPADKFVTAIILEINPETGKAGYVSAGHNECFLLNQTDDEAQRLESTGLPLGMFSGAGYEEKSFNMEDGSLIALFSDGVPEARDTQKQEWGEKNLGEILIKERNNSAGEITAGIIKELDGFAGGAAQHDDITLLVVKYGKV